ncbi:hypothetical protein [Mycolicibacterium sphagni]|uniref:Uncharacterized protein n=1 Tax=Mycolicibacterium sphagni TaxID=1786 RepID=A0ABX2JY08_9MYCO|nr:hypothetical protein [Mycolicibacterium sphagni]NTY62631.1 hypothetical protein [Mycolicibacterium sphagni]
MSLLNPVGLVPEAVFDVVGICGLVALGAAAVAITAAAAVFWRRPAENADRYLPLIRPAVKSLAVLGLTLLAIWAVPWLISHGGTHPLPPPMSHQFGQ